MPKTAVRDDSLFGRFLLVFCILWILSSVISKTVFPDLSNSLAVYMLFTIPFALAMSWALVMLKRKNWEVIEQAGYAYYPQRDATERRRVHFYGKWKKILSGTEITIEPYNVRYGLATIPENLVNCTYGWIVLYTSNPSSNSFNFLDVSPASRNEEMEDKLGPQAFSILQTNLNGIIKRIVVGERITIITENDQKNDRIKILEKFILSIRKHLESE